MGLLKPQNDMLINHRLLDHLVCIIFPQEDGSQPDVWYQISIKLLKLTGRCLITLLQAKYFLLQIEVLIFTLGNFSLIQASVSNLKNHKVYLCLASKNCNYYALSYLDNSWMPDDRYKSSHIPCAHNKCEQSVHISNPNPNPITLKIIFSAFSAFSNAY